MMTKPDNFKDEFSTGGLKMFATSVKILKHKELHTFKFSIRATSCVYNYQIKLPCHKAILAARSSVFLDKFIADPNLSQVEIIDPLVTVDDVEQFPEFVYTGQFQLPLISKHLLTLAKTYEVKTLVDLCEYAQREITLIHLMNLAVQLEPYYQQTRGSENYLPEIDTQ